MSRAAEGSGSELPAGLVVFEPKVFADDRGWFYESYSRDGFARATGVEVTWAQDNHSESRRDVVRGLHYQFEPNAQGKLVRCVVGSVFDVAVDLRRSSATFGRWAGLELSAENRKQLWVPEGFAHGFMTLSETAEVLYKASSPYAPDSERSIRWDDPTIGIAWPEFENGPILSDKDADAPLFAESDVFA